jgi:hypothetical protein
LEYVNCGSENVVEKKVEEELRYVVVELSLGFQEGGIVSVHRNFEDAKEIVENEVPSRWNNPVVMVITTTELKKIREGKLDSIDPRTFGSLSDNPEGAHQQALEMIKFGKVFDESERVVAIPMKDGKPFEWGYGYRFSNDYLRNRKKWKCS